MAVIRVPKTPKKAFNKNRPASKLLKSQVAQLEWAVRPASERKPYQLPKASVRTEGEAAARIEELTRRLHPEGAKAAPPVTEPQAAPPRTRKRPAKSRPARRRRSR
jgi:hypothetical protein